MRSIIIIAIAALSLGMATSAMAQVQGTTTSGAGAQAIAGGSMGIGTLVLPGTGGGGSGVQTVWTLGIAPPANAATSYDACLKNVGISAIAGAISIPLEISHCWELRDMDAMAKYPPGSVQYEHGCRDSGWQNTDWVSGTMACKANQAKLAKTNPNDRRIAQYGGTAVPVVQGGMSMPSVNWPPPTVVPMAGTNQMSSAPPTTAAAVDYSRKCKSRNDEQCTM